MKFKFIGTLLVWLITIGFFLYIDRYVLNSNALVYFGALYVRNGQTGSFIRYLSYGFLHSSSHHLFMNALIGIPLMLYLENKIGTLKTLLIYFFGIVFGGVNFTLFNNIERVVTTGASAGIWAMLSAAIFNLLFKEKINLIEFLVLFNVTMVLMFDTSVSPITEVNKIGHISAYIGGMLLISILNLRSCENVQRKFRRIS